MTKFNSTNHHWRTSHHVTWSMTNTLDRIPIKISHYKQWTINNSSELTGKLSLYDSIRDSLPIRFDTTSLYHPIRFRCISFHSWDSISINIRLHFINIRLKPLPERLFGACSRFYLMQVPYITWISLWKIFATFFWKKNSAKIY
jgi:hypothetical protein